MPKSSATKTSKSARYVDCDGKRLPINTPIRTDGKKHYATIIKDGVASEIEAFTLSYYWDHQLVFKLGKYKGETVPKTTEIRTVDNKQYATINDNGNVVEVEVAPRKNLMNDVFVYADGKLVEGYQVITSKRGIHYIEKLEDNKLIKVDVYKKNSSKTKKLRKKAKENKAALSNNNLAVRTLENTSSTTSTTQTITTTGNHTTPKEQIVVTGSRPRKIIIDLNSPDDFLEKANTSQIEISEKPRKKFKFDLNSLDTPENSTNQMVTPSELPSIRVSTVGLFASLNAEGEGDLSPTTSPSSRRS